MEKKKFCETVCEYIELLLFGSLLDSCSVDPRLRRGRGWGGITRGECHNMGYCYDDSHFGVAWCFTEIPGTGREREGGGEKERKKETINEKENKEER